MSSTLKLVILYDAGSNAYTVCDHNLTAQQAKRQVAKLRRTFLSALAVDQRSEHPTSDPQVCKACRRDVGHASGLTPKPRFQRRHNA